MLSKGGDSIKVLSPMFIHPLWSDCLVHFWVLNKMKQAKQKACQTSHTRPHLRYVIHIRQTLTGWSLSPFKMNRHNTWHGRFFSAAILNSKSTSTSYSTTSKNYWVSYKIDLEQNRYFHAVLCQSIESLLCQSIETPLKTNTT